MAAPTAKGSKAASPKAGPPKAALPKAASPEAAAAANGHVIDLENDDDDIDEDDNNFMNVASDGKKLAKHDSLIRQLLTQLAGSEADADIKAALKGIRLSKSTMKTYNYEWREWTRFIFPKAELAWSDTQKPDQQVAALKAYILEKVRLVVFVCRMNPFDALHVLSGLR